MRAALLHPFASPATAEDAYLEIVGAEGCWLTDVRGRRYLDAIANLWLCQVGHGREEMVDAVASQLRELDAYNVFAPFSNRPAVELADAVAARSPHPDGRVFLASSGSEAIDTALKLVRFVQRRRHGDHRQVVIRRTRSYHGTNFGGTAAQGLPLNREGWGDLVPHFVEVPADDPEAVSIAFSEHGEHVAAVLTEPLQGAGGVFPPPGGYLEELRRLCDRHGALLVFDEVITGFGRLGAWFAAQAYGVTPDVITFAKGVTSGYQPLSGVILSRAVAETLEEPGLALRTGYTYSGHPASCAAGLANLAIIERDDLLGRATSLASRFDEGLSALAADGLIEGFRGAGGIWAAELGTDAVAVRDALLGEGVIARPIGTSLAFCPPLVISDAEVACLFDSLESVLGRRE